jgi:hypothetical protein
MKYFSEQEFPEDLEYAETELLEKLDQLRGWYNEPIYPSPASGALARFHDEDSQHYAGGDRKSRAVDWFPGGSYQRAWLLAVTAGFGGVGIYFDTHFRGERHVMLHTDIRDRQPALIWMRIKGEYFYFQYEESAMRDFFERMREF